jgi:hypothetical protein
LQSAERAYDATQLCRGDLNRPDLNPPGFPLGKIDRVLSTPADELDQPEMVDKGYGAFEIRIPRGWPNRW